MYALSNIAALLLNVWQYGISAVNLKKIAFTFLLMQGGGLEAGNPYNSPTWFVSALMVCYVVYFAGACLTMTCLDISSAGSVTIKSGSRSVTMDSDSLSLFDSNIEAAHEEATK